MTNLTSGHSKHHASPQVRRFVHYHNYRGISLMCVMAEMYNRMILNRIQNIDDVSAQSDDIG